MGRGEQCDGGGSQLLEDPDVKSRSDLSITVVWFIVLMSLHK